jgi:hypothetical protein
VIGFLLENVTMRSPFAHILGTIEGGIEQLPGTGGSSEVQDVLGPDERHEPVNIVVPFRNDANTAPLRIFLIATVRSCQELYHNARRLGLPETSVRNKLPWYRYDYQSLMLLCHTDKGCAFLISAYGTLIHSRLVVSDNAASLQDWSCIPA